MSDEKLPFTPISQPNAPQGLDESQIFYVWQPYLFFQTYDNWSIPCLAVILVFEHGFELLS